MSIQVKSFDSKELNEAIKQSPKIIQEYIKAQKRIIDSGKLLQQDALKKIRELTAKKINDTKAEKYLNEEVYNPNYEDPDWGCPKETYEQYYNL